MQKVKLSIVLFLSLCVALAGCKKNDPDPQSLILGKWETKKLTIDQYENGVKATTATSTTFTGDEYIEFKNDGTVVFSSSEGKQNATYTIDTDGEKLSVVYQGSTAVQLIDVRSLTASDLVIYQELPPVVILNKTYKTVLEGTYKK